MKNIFLYASLLIAMLAASCTDSDIVGPTQQLPDEGVVVPEGSVEGELLIKFAPEMSDILDKLPASRAAGVLKTRSGIPSTDAVLDILKAYKLERVFPVDNRTEERTREANMHLWYQVSFDKNVD